MRKLLLTLIITFIIVGAFAQSHVPNISIENDKGQSAELSKIVEAGKPIVYVFWGAICSSCNSGLEALNNEFDEWREELDFQVIAVCTDDVRGASKAKNKAKANEWPFSLLFDKNQELKRAMNVNAVPHFIVTDKDGEAVYSRAGYVPGIEDEIYKALQKAE